MTHIPASNGFAATPYRVFYFVVKVVNVKGAIPTCFAGEPATTTPAGTGLRTTALAATIAFSPTSIS